MSHHKQKDKSKKEKSATPKKFTVDEKDYKLDLEKTIQEKITPLLEKSMEETWGMSIPKIESDITDKLKDPQTNIYISTQLKFNEAKKQFKKEFFKRELRLHQGNISELAQNLELDRRSIHRTVKELEIDMENIRHHPLSEDEFQKEQIDRTIRSTLDQYKEIIQPPKIEQMYKEVESLSRNIVKILPLYKSTWKSAETMFEKKFLARSLEKNQWNIDQVAKTIGLCPETIYRKIKKLKLVQK